MKIQPRTQALTFPLPPPLRKDPGALWSRGSQNIELLREGRTNHKLKMLPLSNDTIHLTGAHTAFKQFVYI